MGAAATAAATTAAATAATTARLGAAFAAGVGAAAAVERQPPHLRRDPRSARAAARWGCTSCVQFIHP
jgi:hypothetical protein